LAERPETPSENPDHSPTGVDVLVLAGDITMARHYEDLASVFKPLARKYRHILYVPGNHEYYKSSPGHRLALRVALGGRLERLVTDR
jgi:predicted phosphodiesterase